MSIEHTFITAEGHETRVLTKAKAIRLKCIECSGFQPGEVAKCTCHDCALYPFRFGNEKGLQRMYVQEDSEPEESSEEVEEITPKRNRKKKIRKKIRKKLKR